MVLNHHNAEQRTPTNAELLGSSPKLLAFSSKWDLLGPFQIGTREASWGADPLESYGGFRQLQYDPNVSYPSSLAPRGQVCWTHCHVETFHEQAEAVEIALHIDFPVVDWKGLQQIYGWAALQYQGWARGELMVDGDEPQTVVLYTDNVLEVWIDDRHYFGGDYYAYRRAPLVLHLCSGSHKLDARIIRDVRVMGGKNSSMSITLRAERSEGSLVVVGQDLLISDFINGTLASPYAALSLRNDGNHMISVRKVEAERRNLEVRMLDDSSPIRLAAGQTRSIRLYVHVLDATDPAIAMKITYTIDQKPTAYFTNIIYHNLTKRDLFEPHKSTFLHPSQLVSYAILRPPSKNATRTVDPGQSLPIHLNLHGAGLEADSHQVRHLLDHVPDLRAFVLFPSGVTPWSGDDWHDWGFGDVKAAIASIADWIHHVGWDGPSADPERWLVSGHSNGGQGTLYALTHYPDKIIGAAPVSGYLSIQKYVPYNLWHEAEPRVTQVIQNSLLEFRHELMVENFSGIPVLHQHGSEDDNVPAFHSRRLHQLASENIGVDCSRYIELPGKGHWYEGVMTTPALIDFYNGCLAGEAHKPALPQDFQIVVARPAGMTFRGGLQVDHLMNSDQLGKVVIKWDATLTGYHFKTSNIECMHFAMDSVLLQRSTQFMLDEQLFNLSEGWVERVRASKKDIYFKYKNGSWQGFHPRTPPNDRSDHRLGTLNAILRTQDTFRIQCLSSRGADVALQISRNLYQYFGADAEVNEGKCDINSDLGNFITISVGMEDLPEFSNSCAITIDPEDGLLVETRDGSQMHYAIEDGLGIIFLQSHSNTRLDLVVWGSDETGLRQAARLFPMLTGVGQADFVVVRKQMGWEGATGALAMGSFDDHWQVSRASFFR